MDHMKEALSRKLKMFKHEKGEGYSAKKSDINEMTEHEAGESEKEEKLEQKDKDSELAPELDAKRALAKHEAGEALPDYDADGDEMDGSSEQHTHSAVEDMKHPPVEKDHRELILSALEDHGHIGRNPMGLHERAAAKIKEKMALLKK